MQLYSIILKCTIIPVLTVLTLSHPHEKHPLREYKAKCKLNIGFYLAQVTLRNNCPQSLSLQIATTVFSSEVQQYW